MINTYYDKQGKALKLLEWANLFEDIEYRRVALTENSKYMVSTVWVGLGLDGVCGIFETGVFGNAKEVDMVKYDTEEQAIAGHKILVDRYIKKRSLLKVCMDFIRGKRR